MLYSHKILQINKICYKNFIVLQLQLILYNSIFTFFNIKIICMYIYLNYEY
jgi:hypothetical protein